MPLLTPHVPGGLIDLMKNLAKEVLREKPENIFEFAAVHFEKLIQQRDGSLDKDYEQFVAFQTHFDGQQRFAVPANSGYTCQRPMKIQPILHTKKSKSDMLASFKAMESINEEDVLAETPYSNEKYQKAIYVIQRYYRRYMAQKKNQSSTTLTASTAAIIIQRTMRRLFANKIKLKTNDEDTAKHDGVVQDDEDVDNVSEAASYTSSSTIQMLADSQEGRENRLPGCEVALSDVSGAANDDGSTGFKEQTTVAQDAAPIIPPPSTTESSEADGKSITDENAEEEADVEVLAVYLQGKMGSIHQEQATPNHHTPAHNDDTSTAPIGKLSTIIGSNDQQNSLHTHTVEIDSNSSDPTQIRTPVVAVGKTPQSLGASPNTLPSTPPRLHREEHFAVHLQGNAYADNSAANPYQSVAHIRKFDPNTGESLKTYDVFSHYKDDPDFSDSLNESTMERDSLENEDLDVDSLESNESVTHLSRGTAKREVDQDNGELYGNTNEVPEQEKQDVHQSVQLERAPTYLYGIHPSRTPIAERKSKRSRNPSAESTKVRDTTDLATTVSIGVDDRSPEERSEEESLESKGSTSEESSATQIENVNNVAHKTDKKATDGDDLKSSEEASIKIDEVDGVPPDSLQKETSSAGNALAINSGEEATTQIDDTLKHGREFSLEKDDTKTPVDGDKRDGTDKGVRREATQIHSERYSRKTGREKPEVHKTDNVILQLAVDKGLSEESARENEEALSSEKPPSRLVGITYKPADALAKIESLVAEVEDQKPSVSPLPAHISKPPAAIENAAEIKSEASRDRSDGGLKEASVSGISDRASDKYNIEKLPKEEGMTVEAKGLFETQKILVSDRGSIDTKDIHQTTILEKIETADNQAKTTTRRHKRSLHDADSEHADTSNQEPSLADENLTRNTEASSKSVGRTTIDHPINKHDLEVEKEVDASSLSSPLGYFAALYSDQSSGGTMSSILGNHDQQVESQLRELQSLTDLYPGLEIKDVMSEFHTRDIQPDDRRIDEDFVHDDNNNAEAYDLGKSEEIPEDQKPSDEREPSIEDSRTVGEKPEGGGEDGHMGQPKGLHESSKEMKVMNSSKIGTTMEEPKMDKDEVSNKDDDVGHAIKTESVFGLNKALVEDSLERHHKSQKMSKGLLERGSDRSGKDAKSNTDATVDDNVKGNISPTDRKGDKMENSGANMAEPETKSEISKQASDENLNTLAPVTSRSKLADKSHEARPEPKLQEEDYFGNTIDRNILANDNPVIEILKADGVTLTAASSKLPKVEEEPHDFVRDSVQIFDSVSETSTDHLLREEKLNLIDANPDANLEVSMVPENRLAPEKGILSAQISSSNAIEGTRLSNDRKQEIDTFDEHKSNVSHYTAPKIKGEANSENVADSMAHKDFNLATKNENLVENALTSSKVPNEDDSLALINSEKHLSTGMQPPAGLEMSKLSESDVEYLKNRTMLPDELKNDEDSIKEGETANDTVGEASMAVKSDSFDIQNKLMSDENLEPKVLLASNKSEKYRAENKNDTEAKNKMADRSAILNTEEKYRDENENDTEGKNKIAHRSDTVNTEEKYSDENESTSSKIAKSDDSLILTKAEKHASTDSEPAPSSEMSKRSDSGIELKEGKTGLPDGLKSCTDNIKEGKSESDTEGKNKMADRSDTLNTEEKYSDENESTSSKIPKSDDSLALTKAEKHSSTDIEPAPSSEMSKRSESGIELKEAKTGLPDGLKSYTDNIKEGKSESDTEGKNQMADRSDTLNTEERYSDENESTSSKIPKRDDSLALTKAETHATTDIEAAPSSEMSKRSESGKELKEAKTGLPDGLKSYTDNIKEGKSESDTEGKNKMADRSDTLNTEERYSDENESTSSKIPKSDDSLALTKAEKHSSTDIEPAPSSEMSKRSESGVELKGAKTGLSDGLKSYTDNIKEGKSESDTEGKNKMADRSDTLNTEERYSDENESTSSKIPKSDDSLALTKAEKHSSTDIEPAPSSEMSKRSESGVELKGAKTGLSDGLKSYTDNIKEGKSESDTEGKNKMADRSDTLNTEERYSDENESTSSKIPKSDDSLALTKAEKHSSTDIEPAPSSEMSKRSESGVELKEAKTGLPDGLKSYTDNIKEGKSENDTEGKNKMAGRSAILNTEEKYRDENENDSEGKNKMDHSSDTLNTEERYSDENESTSSKIPKSDDSLAVTKPEKRASTDSEPAPSSEMSKLSASGIELKEAKTGLSDGLKSYTDNIKEGKSESDTEGKNQMADSSDTVNTEEKYSDENELTSSKIPKSDDSLALTKAEKHSSTDIEPASSSEMSKLSESGIELKEAKTGLSDGLKSYTDNIKEGKSENDTEGKNKIADRSDILNTEEKYRAENKNDTEVKNKMADRSAILNTEEKCRDENENDTEGKNKMAHRSDILNTEERYSDENESTSSKIPKRDDNLALTKAETLAPTDIEAAPALEISNISEDKMKRPKSNENQGPVSKIFFSDDNDEAIATNVTLEESKAILIAEADKKHITDKELMSNKTMKIDNHSARNKAEQLNLTDTQIAAISIIPELSNIDIESPQDISSTKLRNLSPSKSPALTDDIQRMSKDSISKRGENENEKNYDSTENTNSMNDNPDQMKVLKIENDRLVENLPTSSKFVKEDRSDVKQTSQELEVIGKSFSIQRTATDDDSSESVNLEYCLADNGSELRPHENDSAELKPVSEGSKELKSMDLKSENETPLPINPNLESKLKVLKRTSKPASLEDGTMLGKKDDLGVVHSEINLEVDHNITVEQSDETLVVSKDPLIKDMSGLEFQEKNVYPDNTYEIKSEKSALALNIPKSAGRLGLTVSVSEPNDKPDQVSVEQLHDSSEVAEDVLMKDKLGLEHVSSDVDASLNQSVRAVYEGKIPDSSFKNIKPSLLGKTLEDTGVKNKTPLGVPIGELPIVSPHMEGERSGIADPLLKTNSEQEISVTSLPKLYVEPQRTEDQLEAMNEAIGKPESFNSIEASEPCQVDIQKQIEDVKELKDRRLETDILPNDYVENKQADDSSIEQLNAVPSSVSLPTEVTSCDDSNAETSADFSSIGKDLDFFEDTIHYLKSATAQLTTLDFTEDEKKRQSGEGVMGQVADEDSEMTSKPGDALYQVKEDSINQKENRSPVIETAKADETESRALEQINEQIDSKTKNLTKPDYTASHPTPPQIAREKPTQKMEKSVKSDPSIYLQHIKNPIENETHKIKSSITREKPIERKSKPIKSESLDKTKTSVKSNSFDKGQLESPPGRTKIPVLEKQKTVARPLKGESDKRKWSKVPSTSNLLERDRSAKSKRTQFGWNVRSVSVKEQNPKVDVFDLEAIKKDLLSTKKVRSSKNSRGRPKMAQQKYNSPIKLSKFSDSAKKSKNSIDKSKLAKGNVDPKEHPISDELQSATAPTVESLKENFDSSHQNSATTIQKTFRGYRTRKHLKSVSATEQSKNPEMTAVTEDNLNIVNARSGADLVQKQSDDETNKNSKESDTSGIFDTLKRDVEDFKNTALDKSATKIQKTFRGFRTRKSLKGDDESPRRSTSDVLNKSVKSGSILVRKRLSEEMLDKKEKGQNNFVKLKNRFEDANNETLNKSATTIQKNFRGYKTRKNLKKAKSFESASDKTFTIKSNPKEVGETLNKDFTTCITTTEENLGKVQRVSPKIDENPNKEKESSSSTIFENLKPDVDSFKNAALDKSAVKIQKTFRGYKTRKSLKNDNSPRPTNQTSDQTFAVEPKALQTENEDHKDSREIDTRTSGKIKSDVAENYKGNSLDKSATTIQKTFRGYKTRKVLKDDLRKTLNARGRQGISEKSINILNADGKTLTKESESNREAKDDNWQVGTFDNSQSDAEESPALDEFATTIQETFGEYNPRKEIMAKDANLKEKSSDANMVELSNSGTKSNEMLTSSQPQSGDVGKSESETLGPLQKLSKNESNGHGMKKSKSADEMAFNDVSEKAAITIQKTYKGFKARKELKTGGKFNKDIEAKQPLSKNDANSHITSNSEDVESSSEDTTKVDTENSTNSEREYLNAVHRDDPAESFSLMTKTTRAASAGALLGAAASTIQKAFRDYHSRKESTLHKTKSYSHGAQRDNAPTIDTSDESSTFIGPDTSFDLSDIDSVGTKSTPTLEMEISNPPSFALSTHSEEHDIENDCANATHVSENSLAVSPQRILRKRSIIDATAPLLADILNAGESTDSNEKPQWYVGEDLIIPSTDTGPSTFQNPLASSSSFDKSSSLDSRIDSFISNLQPTPSINSAVVSTSSLLFDTKDTEMHDTIKNTPKHLNKHSRAVSADEEEKRTEKETEVRNEVNNCQGVDKADEKTEKQSVDEEYVFEENGATSHGLTDLAESLLLTSTDPFSPRNVIEDVKNASQVIVTELCKNCADGVHEVHEEDITMITSGQLPAAELSDKTENPAVNPGDSKDIIQSTNKHFDEIKQFVLMEEDRKTTERSSENSESKKVNEINGNDTETSAAVKNGKEQGDNQMSNATRDDGQSELPLVDQVNPNDDDTNVGPSIALIPASSEEESSDRESNHEFEKISQTEKNAKHGEKNVTAAEKEKSQSKNADANESEKSNSEKQQLVDICQGTVPATGDEVKEIDIGGESETVALDSTDSPSKTKPLGSESDLKDSIREETKIEVDSTETEKILNDRTEKSEHILQESTTVKSHETNLDGALNSPDIETDKNPATKPTKDSRGDSEERNQNVAIVPEEMKKIPENNIDVEAETVGETKETATTELNDTGDVENVNTKQQSRTKDSEDSGEYVSIDKPSEDSPEPTSNTVHPLDIAEKSKDTPKKNEDQKFEDNFNESCTDKIAVKDPIKIIHEIHLSSVVSVDKTAESTLHESLKIDEENATNSENGDSKVAKSKSSSGSANEANEIPADVGLLEESKLKGAESSHKDDSSKENVDEADVSKSNSNIGEVKKGANDLKPKAHSEEDEVQNKSQDEIPSEEKTASDSGNSNIDSTLEWNNQSSKEPESLLTDGIHKQSSKDADLKVADEKDPDHSEDPRKLDIKIKSDADLKVADEKDPEVKSEDWSEDLEKSTGHTEDPGKVDINPKPSKEGAAPITEHKVTESKEDLEIASKLLEGCLRKTDLSHSLGSDRQPSVDGESANFTTDVKPSSEDVKSEQNSPEQLSLSGESLTIQANLEKLIDESVRQIENDVNPINPQDLPVENSPNEVVEVPCVKKVLPPTPLSATSEQDESELESTTTKAESTTTSPGYDGASDIDALEIPPSLPDSLEAMAEKLRETDEMVARMHQRRASEHKTSIEIADQPLAYEERVSEPIRPMRELQKSSSTEVEDDIILQKLQRGNTTRESSAQSESVIFGDSTSQLTESEDTFTDSPDVKALHRMNTIAVERNSYKPANLLQKSVTIDDTVKYIDPEKSTEESGGSFCLDDAISADVRKKLMAYSISEADSDYCDAGELTARLHDDFNISTALDAFPSSDTDTTIVSAATKIQAGARGFLTRRRLRRASMGTKSSLNEETKTSFGNDAIGESLDRLVEEEVAKRMPKVQYHRQVGVNSLPSALGNSTETETPSREQIHAGDDSDDLNLAAKLTSVAEEIYATPHGEGSSIDGQRGNRNLSKASENDVNGGQETDDESAQVPPNLEATLAARRLTLQRGDAMRNDSTPDDDNGNAKQVDPAKSIPAAAAGTMLIHLTTMVDSTTMATTPAEATTTTTMTTTIERRNYSDAAMAIKMDKVKWFAMRQNSMPVQIDSEVFRVLPKHMRKRIKSAEGEQRKRIRLPRD